MKADPEQIINFPIKLSEKIMVNLQIKYPIEDDDLDKFLTTLEALKPGTLQSVLDKQSEKKNEN